MFEIEMDGVELSIGPFACDYLRDTVLISYENASGNVDSKYPSHLSQISATFEKDLNEYIS